MKKDKKKNSNLKDDNLYRRLPNGRYEAIGICNQLPVMYDGVWYVRHKPYSKATTSVPYMASLFHMDVNPVDINVVCSLQDMADYVTESDEWRELLNNEKGFNLTEIVSLTIAKVYEKQKAKEKENESRL